MSKKTTTERPARKVKVRESRPATTPEGREQQLVNLAVELAEKQLRDGTAAPSIINHYLKVASRREVLEREILAKQSELIEAKVKSMGKDSESDELARAAIEAMKQYTSGSRTLQ